MSDFDGINFDMDTEDLDSNKTTIPEGDYPVVITICEKKLSKNNNQMIYLEAEVTGDNYAGWIVREYFMLWSENPKIAISNFTRLSKACGLENMPNVAYDLHGKAFTANLKIDEAEKDSGYSDQMRIYSYTPLVTAPLVTAPKAAGMPPSMS
tara:strand:- start:971 stop:1426 length:456 start_codon:yes stop_codon:yes gene_type:complete